ncbi:MAG TPA: hypothetical protein VME47_13830 [Acetobacteraceae bacterium]|nr:hypothetical protein [Acetobacteraceae bacterium]
MGEPTEILTDQHIEVAIVDGQGDRQAVMLRDPRTKQSVTLMLSDQRTADRGVWLRMRGFVSNRPLRRTSDEIIDYVDTTPPAWDVEVEFETSPVFHHLASVHIHPPEDTEPPMSPTANPGGAPASGAGSLVPR